MRLGPHGPAARPAAVGDGRGAVLLTTVLGILLLSTALLALVAVSRTEVLIVQNERDRAQAFLAAEAGAAMGRWILRQRLTIDLPRHVAARGKGAMASDVTRRYRGLTGAAWFLVELARSDDGPNFALCGSGGCPDPPWDRDPATGRGIPDDQQAVLAIRDEAYGYAGRVIVSAMDDPATPWQEPVISPRGDYARFTYRWRVESRGIAGRAVQEVTLASRSSAVPSGAFEIVLIGEFTQFAHLVNDAQRGSGGEAWMSTPHDYDGPVHTNTRLNIAFSPIFRAGATQAYPDVRFYHGDITLARDSHAPDLPRLGPDALPCHRSDCPGFERNTSAVSMPSGVDRDRLRAATLGWTAPTLPPGYTVHVGIGRAGAPAGGIFVKGDILGLELAANPEGLPGQRITITQPGDNRRTVITENWLTRQTTLVRQCRPAPTGGACMGGGTEFRDDPTLPTRVFSGLTNGLVFVEDGGILALRGPVSGAPAVYRDSQLSVAADRTIRVTAPIRYEVDPRGPDGVWGSSDDRMETRNVLGLVSWSEDVVIDSSTPDMDLHFAVMTPDLDGRADPQGTGRGEFRVEGYDRGGPRGQARLLGGVTQAAFGPFGTFDQSGRTQTGYALLWSHDHRFAVMGIAPPLFPTLADFLVIVQGFGFTTYTWRQGR